MEFLIKYVIPFGFYYIGFNLLNIKTWKNLFGALCLVTAGMIVSVESCNEQIDTYHLRIENLINQYKGLK